MKAPTIISLVSSLLLAAGCATPGVHEADRGLEGTLRSEINERHVHLDVDHGIVKLEGHVRTSADRERIESLVRNTTGVVAVKDNLRVTFPSPGTFGANPSSTIPIYTGELPPAPAVAVVTPPSALVIPEYPKLKVQAETDADQAEAALLVAELRTAGLPSSGLEDVTIKVRNGNVTLQGDVETQADRGALIAAVQSTEGVRAIYDRLRVVG